MRKTSIERTVSKTVSVPVHSESTTNDITLENLSDFEARISEQRQLFARLFGKIRNIESTIAGIRSSLTESSINLTVKTSWDNQLLNLHGVNSVSKISSVLLAELLETDGALIDFIDFASNTIGRHPELSEKLGYKIIGESKDS